MYQISKCIPFFASFMKKFYSDGISSVALSHIFSPPFTPLLFPIYSDLFPNLIFSLSSCPPFISFYQSLFYHVFFCAKRFHQAGRRRRKGLRKVSLNKTRIQQWGDRLERCGTTEKGDSLVFPKVCFCSSLKLGLFIKVLTRWPFYKTMFKSTKLACKCAYQRTESNPYFIFFRSDCSMSCTSLARDRHH